MWSVGVALELPSWAAIFFVGDFEVASWTMDIPANHMSEDTPTHMVCGGCESIVSHPLPSLLRWEKANNKEKIVVPISDLIPSCISFTPKSGTRAIQGKRSFQFPLLVTCTSCSTILGESTSLSPSPPSSTSSSPSSTSPPPVLLPSSKSTFSPPPPPSFPSSSLLLSLPPSPPPSWIYAKQTAKDRKMLTSTFSLHKLPRPTWKDDANTGLLIFSPTTSLPSLPPTGLALPSSTFFPTSISSTHAPSHLPSSLLLPTPHLPTPQPDAGDTVVRMLDPVGSPLLCVETKESDNVVWINRSWLDPHHAHLYISIPTPPHPHPDPSTPPHPDPSTLPNPSILLHSYPDPPSPIFTDPHPIQSAILLSPPPPSTPPPSTSPPPIHIIATTSQAIHLITHSTTSSTSSTSSTPLTSSTATLTPLGTTLIIHHTATALTILTHTLTHALTHTLTSPPTATLVFEQTLTAPHTTLILTPDATLLIHLTAPSTPCVAFVSILLPPHSMLHTLVSPTTLAFYDCDLHMVHVLELVIDPHDPTQAHTTTLAEIPVPTLPIALLPTYTPCPRHASYGLYIVESSNITCHQTPPLPSQASSILPSLLPITRARITPSTLILNNTPLTLPALLPTRLSLSSPSHNAECYTLTLPTQQSVPPPTHAILAYPSIIPLPPTTLSTLSRLADLEASLPPFLQSTFPSFFSSTSFVSPDSLLLFRQALTSPAFASAYLCEADSYECLEFVGDAVLDAALSFNVIESDVSFTQSRTLGASNASLSLLFYHLHLDSLPLLLHTSLPESGAPMPVKPRADMVEALLGALTLTAQPGPFSVHPLLLVRQSLQSLTVSPEEGPAVWDEFCAVWQRVPNAETRLDTLLVHPGREFRHPLTTTLPSLSRVGDGVKVVLTEGGSVQGRGGKFEASRRFTRLSEVGGCVLKALAALHVYVAYAVRGGESVDDLETRVTTLLRAQTLRDIALDGLCIPSYVLVPEALESDPPVAAMHVQALAGCEALVSECCVFSEWVLGWWLSHAQSLPLLPADPRSALFRVTSTTAPTPSSALQALATLCRDLESKDDDDNEGGGIVVSQSPDAPLLSYAWTAFHPPTSTHGFGDSPTEALASLYLSLPHQPLHW